jgi:purine-binding chemotaxis protein CheW
MTSTLPLPTPQGEPSFERCRAVVFAIAGHFLALPLTAVVKVVSAAAASHLPSAQPSLIYLDNQPITLLNLQPCLSAVATSHASVQPLLYPGQFLLIASDQEQLFAISLNQVPTLMELPLSVVRLLPKTYRQSIQNIAFHVAVLTHETQTQTILLLDLQQAMKAQESFITKLKP